MAAKQTSRSMEHPIFGPIKWDGEFGWWEGSLRLPFFKGYDTTAGSGYEKELLRQMRTGEGEFGAIAAEEYRRLKEGLLRISIHDEAGDGPSPAQEAAVRHLLQNEAEVSQAVVKGIFQNYRETYEEYEEFLGDEDSDDSRIHPKLKSREGLKKLVRLSSLDFHAASKDGVGHVGFSFHSTWEEEHGIGVLTHGGKVIEVGYMDVAFSEPDIVEPPASVVEALARAMAQGQVPEVRQLLAQGLPADVVRGALVAGLEQGDEHGRLLSCKIGIWSDLETIRKLLAAGADPSHSEKGSGLTALHWAAAVRPVASQAVRLLLEAGADPNRIDAGGSTPLHRAAAPGENTAEGVRMLLQHGAKVDIWNHEGRTPLHEACLSGDDPMSKMLLEAMEQGPVKEARKAARTPAEQLQAKMERRWQEGESAAEVLENYLHPKGKKMVPGSEILAELEAYLVEKRRGAS